MILTAIHGYKKYKKHKQEKEEGLAADSGRHDRLVEPAQDKISNSSAENLRATSEEDTAKELPPRYKYSQIRGQSPNPASPFSGRPNSQQDLLQQRTRSPVPLPSFPPHSPSSLLIQGQQTPTEIPVSGKWVWVPDNSQSVDPIAQQPEKDTPYGRSISVAELPASDVPRIEIDDHRSGNGSGRGKNFAAELDGRPIRDR